MKKKISLILTTIILIIPIFIKAQTPVNTSFDDYNFYKCIIDAYNEEENTKFDYNHNLTDEELQKIKKISCIGTNKQDSEKINSVKGIEKITQLIDLDLSNNNLSEIDLSNNIKLENLNLSNNNLNTINISTLNQLTWLILSGSNKLSEIDLSNNIKLETLEIYNINLKSLDLTKNTNLTKLILSLNNLNTIDLSKNTNLETLQITDNNLNEIDLSKNTQLTTLDLYRNKLSKIDLSNNTKLSFLNLGENNLLSLNIDDLIELGGVDYKEQFSEVPFIKEGDKYIVNLKKIDNKLDASKVIFENTDTIKYDNINGRFILNKKIDTLNYNYKVEVPNSSEEEMMDVSLTLKYEENSETLNPEDSAKENSKTIVIVVICIFVIVLLGICGYYIIKKNKKIEL